MTGQPKLSKAATLKDVAREAGVSIAAASYSLNGGGTIGDEVRARVRDVAQRLGYRPNRSAQSVRTGRNTTLGLLLPDLRNPYFPALAQSIEHAARQAGYTVMLIDTSGVADDELEGMRHLESQGVAGAIWCQTTSVMDAPTRPFVMPVVIIGVPDLIYDNVTIEDRQGGRQLAHHLLALGHRRFGILAGASVAEGRNERTNGFIEALEGKGEIVWRERTPFSIDLPDAVRDRMAQRDVTALMCGNDMLAIGALRTARQLGIDVPGEMSVAGFDDIPWASIVTPGLTTVKQPVEEMAAAALTLLLDRLADPARPVRHFKVGVSLVQRDSTAAAPIGQSPMPGSQ
ncbi:LacI family DNA-binding transcriptional regulator [Pelagibacterium halotolerans]|uniref:Ribose operon repressor n=1 Tax=Pelagibacterium halotolerans (strain DSM 22347 / JCM 15775 / CGMCC 1.7692 / B2) TaxID=1082931 RepID=G4REL6_PELHB|nr:LacI family DNA-binding transcriptional regulator [Pelagibacterium halotolerans]AEQ50866.1 ribose operon repressor [Pelagibacterium halotolerans B2]QJR19224.1 LacI family transcriptional regulator [Pelagibacterium halotolerans]SDZ98385.1 transcriptional regulator, LacI family [Pelagibacterium halotolerans]